jgi:hypothetical protein
MNNSMTDIYLLFFLNLAQAQFKSSIEPSPWCLDKPVSVKKKQLECLRSTVQAKTLRQILNEVASGKRKAPSLNPSGQIDKREFLKLMPRPILVFQVSPSETAGYDVHFVFKNFLRHEFLAWFAPDGSDGFILDMLVDSGPEKKSARIRMKLRQKEFQRYWL